MHTQTLSAGSDSRGFAVDTTFVLFFLAVDFGQSAASFGLDGIFSAMTLFLLIVVPYFLPFDGERPEFGNWVFGRVLIAGFAAVLGLMFGQSVGVVLPDAFRFLPMTLLIASAMVSCYIQFHEVVKYRLAR